MFDKFFEWTRKHIDYIDGFCVASNIVDLPYNLEKHDYIMALANVFFIAFFQWSYMKRKKEEA